jgi:hypothetical protein
MAPPTAASSIPRCHQLEGGEPDNAFCLSNRMWLYAPVVIIGQPPSHEAHDDVLYSPMRKGQNMSWSDSDLAYRPMRWRIRWAIIINVASGLFNLLLGFLLYQDAQFEVPGQSGYTFDVVGGIITMAGGALLLVLAILLIRRIRFAASVAVGLGIVNLIFIVWYVIHGWHLHAHRRNLVVPRFEFPRQRGHSWCGTVRASVKHSDAATEQRVISCPDGEQDLGYLLTQILFYCYR